MTTDLLWGIAIGCVALIGIIKLIQMSNALVQETTEIREVLILYRTVGMAIQNIITPLFSNNIRTAIFHISVAKERLRHFTPTTDVPKKIVGDMSTIVYDIDQILHQLKQEDIGYPRALELLRTQVNAYAAIGVILDEYRGGKL